MLLAKSAQGAARGLKILAKRQTSEEIVRSIQSISIMQQ
jgi:hypothetical protein